MVKNISVICYDLPAVSRFFRSCALAIATQQATHIEWQTYKDSAVLNAIYSVLFWKEPPGTVVVNTGSQARIEHRADTLHAEFLHAWLRKLHEQGPQVANTYVTQMEQLREYARAAVQDMFRDANAINADIVNETNHAIKNLARIKLASQVGVALISGVYGVGLVAMAAGGGSAGAGLAILGVEAGAPGWAFTAVGAANSITHSVIKEWEKGGTAQVVGIAKEGGKIGAEHVADHLAEHSLKNALEGSAKSQHIIRSAEGQIRKYSERLAEEGLRKAAVRKANNIVAANTARVASERAAIQGYGRTAARAFGAKLAIPVVFSAWDIYEAFGDYRETVESLH